VLPERSSLDQSNRRIHDVNRRRKLASRKGSVGAENLPDGQNQSRQQRTNRNPAQVFPNPGLALLFGVLLLDSEF
jgi:hypothetical protein